MKHFYKLTLIALLFATPSFVEGAPAPAKSPNIETHVLGHENIKVYPNPSHDKFYVLVPTGEKAIIQLFDATGSDVSGYEIEQNESYVYEVNTSNLIEGVYVVQIQTENVLKTVRMVVA